MWARFGGRSDDHRTAFLDAADVGVEVFQTQRELVEIEPHARYYQYEAPNPSICA